MKIRPLELLLTSFFVVLAAVAGWIIVNDSVSDKSREKEKKVLNQLVTNSSHLDQQTNRSRTKSVGNFDQVPPLAHPNERLLQFATEEDYQNFLSSLDGSKVRLRGRIDSLRAARVSFDRPSDLGDLGNSDDASFNFLVSLPLPPGDGQVQAGAVGFGRNALEWLGIDEDNSAWGEGVTLAVIDTGISEHPALPENITHIDLSGAEGATADLNGHGTAVASLIAGQNNITPGVSPSIQLIDVRVADSSGLSTSFQLAEGIVAAVDAGADVLNISLGSLGDSPVVERAVEYAYEQGSVIVASSGNQGIEQAAFPAGYDQVIAVGAVDQLGTLVDFSNTGESLDITAPGLEVPAAWTNDNYISFTGTSASSPYVAGAIATAIDQFGLTPQQAADYVLEFSNEAGAPGQDPSFGQGHLDVGRVIDSQTSGINDIAAVSNLVNSEEGSSVISVVQNQGTEFINNAEVTITTPFSTIPLQVGRLAPGEIQTFDIPTTLPDSDTEFIITTEATLNRAFRDAEPENNVETTFFSAEVESEQ